MVNFLNQTSGEDKDAAEGLLFHRILPWIEYPCALTKDSKTDKEGQRS